MKDPSEGYILMLVRRAAMEFAQELQVIAVETHRLLQSTKENDSNRIAIVRINHAVGRGDPASSGAIRVRRPLTISRPRSDLLPTKLSMMSDEGKVKGMVDVSRQSWNSDGQRHELFDDKLRTT